MIIKIGDEQYDCIVKLSRYSNGRLKMDLVDRLDGMFITTVSENISDHPCNVDSIFVKNHSENKGIYSQLVHYNVISRGENFGKKGEYLYVNCKFLGQDLENIGINNPVYFGRTDELPEFDLLTGNPFTIDDSKQKFDFEHLKGIVGDIKDLPY